MIINTLLKKFYFLFFLILPFVLPYDVLAENYLVDNFDSLGNWVFIPSSTSDFNSWSVSNNKLIGNINRKGSSLLISKMNNFGENLDFSFNGTNINGIDQEVLFGVKDLNNYYVLNTRFEEPSWSQDKNINQVVLWKYYSGTYHEMKRIELKNFGINLEKNVAYEFSIIIRNNEIVVYINDILIFSIVDQNLFYGGVGFWNWGGDYSKTVNYYSDLRINSFLIPTPTPIPTNTPFPDPTLTPTLAPTITPTPTPTFTSTPTPTPIPIPKKKIFILPGLGASWNPEAIVYNKNVSNNDWKMTPFVNNYDGLIENLEKNGLVRNQDFFVWNYDWRRSISESENNFNIFLESKNISNNDEIYLIGHSLGGVVARIWGQEHSNDQRLKNIITLGSPHLGSLDVYTVWNGGKVANSKGLSSVIFQILLNLQNKGFITDLNKLRAYAPVVKDLLPTYDNYVSRNGILLKQNQLETKNNFLIDKNNQVSKISDKLFLSTGVGFSTPNIIKLINRSVFDKTFGLWPDGKFVGYGYENGDGTVLKNSASFGSTELTELNSDHGEIVSNSLTFIMSKLGLESKKVDFIYNDNFANSLIVFVGSPATVSLKCENDIFNEVDGFVVINNKNYKDCSLNLNPIDNGTVHLVVGNTNNNDWNYIEKEVSLSNKEKVIINFSDGSIKTDKLNKDFLISWIKSDLQQIKLDSAIKYLEKGNLNQVVKMIFVYRWKTKEMVVSQRILNNLFILGSINKPNKKNINYKWIYINKDYLSKRIKNNRYSAYSFDKLNKFIEYKKYPDEEMARSFFDGYLMEALGN